MNDELQGKVRRAHDEIARLCSQPDRRWRMSIPANPDRDSDLILSDALTALEAELGQAVLERDVEARVAESRLAEIEQLKTELAIKNAFWAAGR